MTAPQPGAPGDQMSPNSKAMIAAAVAALVLIAGGVAVYFYLRDDAPAEVDINTAVDDSSTNTTAADGTATTSAGDASIDGTWSLEPTTEELVYDKPTGSFAGFRVKEEISGIGSTEAVGRTRAVNGSVTIATGGVWSGGAGSFTPNNTALNATYTPTATEISARF